LRDRFNKPETVPRQSAEISAKNHSIQLKLIALGKRAGFKLEDIASMFTRDGTPDLPRDTLRQKADEIDRQIDELATLRDTLRHVADCRAPSHMECPTFRRLLGR
jgi:DNA-binding transcriptional MerR regulator